MKFESDNESETLSLMAKCLEAFVPIPELNLEYLFGEEAILWIV